MSRKRFVELDALRAFAVLLVIWVHSTNIDIGLTGYHGVLLFFVISGFLITGILLDARAAATQSSNSYLAVLRAFYVRRFLRIFPIYYAVLFLAVAVGAARVRAALGWHLAYLSNWYFCYRGELDLSHAGHLWSLAVEEQFYLLWPWFAILLPAAALPWAIGVMILTGPVSRFAAVTAGFNDIAVWYTTPTVLDALGLGCLLAYLWRHTKCVDRVVRWALLCGVLGVGLQLAITRLKVPGPFIAAINTLGWPVICMWLVHRAAWGINGVVGRVLRSRPLVYLGTISYGVYLIHFFVMSFASRVEHRLGIQLPMPNQRGLQQFFSVSLVSIGAAALSWRFFERPINSLKNLFPYARGPRLAKVGVDTSAR
jgi:peptidoglycan/LPS O-acetylase OafA/YrhL